MLAVAAAQVRMRPAVPVAAVLLAACYVQVFFGILPLGRKDPGSRLLGYGMAEVARALEARHPAAILTTDYETTAWLRFYGRVPVVQVNEPERGLGGALTGGHFLYVAERDRHALFAAASPQPEIVRSRDGVPIAHYAVYEVTP
jgi:hypothetical protein